MAECNEQPFVGVFSALSTQNVWWKWNLFERFARESRHNGITFRDKNTWNEIYENLFRQNENFSYKEKILVSDLCGFG